MKISGTQRLRRNTSSLQNDIGSAIYSVINRLCWFAAVLVIGLLFAGPWLDGQCAEYQRYQFYVAAIALSLLILLVAKMVSLFAKLLAVISLRLKGEGSGEVTKLFLGK